MCVCVRACVCAHHPVIITIRLPATFTDTSHGFPQQPQTNVSDQFPSNPDPSVIYHLPSSFHAVVGLLWKGQPEDRESIPSRAWYSCLLHTVLIGHEPPLKWVSWAHSPGAKRPGRESHHIPLPRAEVECLKVYLHSPLCLHGVNELSTGIASSFVCIVETASLKI
jgi:hypothetical protein